MFDTENVNQSLRTTVMSQIMTRLPKRLLNINDMHKFVSIDHGHIDLSCEEGERILNSRWFCSLLDIET